MISRLHLLALQAGSVPADLLPEALSGWVGPSSYQDPKDGGALLSLSRYECRQRVAMVMLRRSAPCRHLLPVADLGDLPDAFAAHAPTLLAAHVASVLTGGPGIRGLLREGRQSTAGCYPDETRYGLVNVTTGGMLYLARVRTKRQRCDERVVKRTEALAEGFALLLSDALHVTWPTIPEKG